MKKGDLKKFLNKFWFIVWKDDSLRGWFLSIIFIFVVIKFIFFPILSLVTGTALPLAIVESCSMYHEGNLISNYNTWWQIHEQKYSQVEIEKQEFKKFIFNKGFNKGDILFIIKAKPEKIKIGDVIIFNAGIQNPIIHRVIKIEKKDNNFIFSTMGDNNNGQLSIEKIISQDQLVGKAVFKIAPYLGWGKLVFYERLRPENQRGFCKQN